MAICLGMATDTMHKPPSEKGVEVVYGYSQSVTFAGDYLFEETFWDEMLNGNTVADSIATMKQTWDNWDWSTKIASYYYYSDGYSTISEARADYAAFPIKGTSFYGADSLQTVKSTYTLFKFPECAEHTWVNATCTSPKTCSRCQVTGKRLSVRS